jgi:hypothetical protein
MPNILCRSKPVCRYNSFLRFGKRTAETEVGSIDANAGAITPAAKIVYAYDGKRARMLSEISHVTMPSKVAYVGVWNLFETSANFSGAILSIAQDNTQRLGCRKRAGKMTKLQPANRIGSRIATGALLVSNDRKIMS